MKKILILIIFTVNLYSGIMSQSTYDYIVFPDSIQAGGLKIIDGIGSDNFKVCKAYINEDLINYSPSEIKEYGIKKGSIYVSRSIEIDGKPNLVFLERLSEGSLLLYRHFDSNKNRYFIEKHGEEKLIELENRNTTGMTPYKRVLKKLMIGCGDFINNINQTRFGTKPLTEVVTKYNYCDDSPVSFFKFGVYAGIKTSELVLKKSRIVQSPKFDVLVGVLFDFPIYGTNFSIHPELYYSNTAFSYSYYMGLFQTNNESISIMNIVDVHASSINLPLMLRYTYSNIKSKIIPYGNIGAQLSYKFKNDNSNIFEKRYISGELLKTEVLKDMVLSNINVGFTIGAGIQYLVSNRNYLFIELRYNNLYGSKEQDGNISGMQIISGINF